MMILCEAINVPSFYMLLQTVIIQPIPLEHLLHTSLCDNCHCTNCSLVNVLCVSWLTCITRIGKPVSLANCSRICLVGFGVWLNAFFNTSNCLALIVVRGPRRFDPFAPSSGLLFSACESPRQSGSPSIEPYLNTG